jgi:deazaflavin-dependent oxidoreductase (nitroreductase family)
VKSKPILRALLHAPVYLYRWRLGWLLGHRFLLLTHIGRRSGKQFQTVVEVMEYHSERREAVVMSGFGRNSDWLRNIETSHGAEIDIASEHFLAAFRFLDEEEAIRVVASYEQHNRFMRPVVRWVLRCLLGWNYTGSDADRHKLVQQLPLIAFRPRS